MFQLTGFALLFLSVTIGFMTVFLLKFDFKKHQRKKALLAKFSGPYQYPIIGSFLELVVPREDFHLLQMRFQEKYGDRYVLYSFGMYFVILTNPNDAEKLLTSSVHISKGPVYQRMESWLGKGLLTNSGENWLRRRKMLTPSFHFRVLEDFVVVFNEQSQLLVDILRKDFDDGKKTNICPYFSRCTMDIVAETMMGSKLGTQLGADTKFFDAVEQVCGNQGYRFTAPHLWNDFIFFLTPMGRKHKAALKIIHGITEKVIKQRKELHTRNNLLNKTDLKEKANNQDIYWYGKPRLALLDLLLNTQKNNDNNLSDLDIRDEVNTFIFEGHDTISSSLSWTVFLLSCYPQFQKRVHEELDGIFGGDKTRPITSQDVAGMKFLSACIKESLRLYPSVPFFSRLLHEELVLDEETTIPVGCEVYVGLIPLQQNEKYFKNAKGFLPDRFLPGNEEKTHSFSHVPFSAGPRNCIGQKFAMLEEKILLANLFRNFVAETDESLDDVVIMLEVITRPRDGFKIRLLPR